MKHLIEKDIKVRRQFCRYEWKRVVLKVLSKIGNPVIVKSWKKIPISSSPVRIRNRCQLTGRAGSVYRRFRLSRMALREEGNKGRLVGVRRASW